MKQIRIYYESLEQGFNYIKPIVERAIDKDTEIVIVRRPKKASEVNNGSISALLTMTTPDILITGIYNKKEFPLVLIEFSEAVVTEDHELQRTYGAIAAYLAGAYYIKLSGEKKSEKEFGGASYDPYSTPKIFIERIRYEGYIIAKWETERGNSFILKRNSKYPSCPPKIPLFIDTIYSAVNTFIKTPQEWFTQSFIELKKKSSYKKYRKMVDSASGTKELLSSWKHRNDANPNKLRYFIKPKWIGAKINRFSHAMDPDRGILTFMSFLFSDKVPVFGIYSLVRPRGNAVMKQNMNTITQMRSKLLTALEMDKEGLPKWLIQEFQKVANKAKNCNDVFNFQAIWEEHREELTENKVVMTIAYFLDGIKFNHNGITLVWDKRKLVNTCCKDFMPALAKHFGFTKYTTPTPIIEVTEEVNEDEVTYAIIHRVLAPNGFKIISVSYPGSQGGGAILPNPKLGKAQPREYPDIIAIPPKGSKIDVVLNESKGMFIKSAIEKDLSKVQLYKTDPNHKEALKNTLMIAQVIDNHKQLKNIVIGVSFGAKSNGTTNWKPANVDFIFRIVDRKQWAIGVFKQQMKDLISKIEGQTRFPKIFKCKKTHVAKQFAETRRLEAEIMKQLDSLQFNENVGNNE